MSNSIWTDMNQKSFRDKKERRIENLAFSVRRLSTHIFLYLH